MIAEMGVYCGFTAKQSKLILQSPMLFRREFPQLQSTAIRVGRTHFHASWKGMTNFRPELPTTVDISSLTPEMRSTMLKYQPTFLDRDLWLKIRNYVFELVVRVEPPKTHDLTRALHPSAQHDLGLSRQRDDGSRERVTERMAAYLFERIATAFDHDAPERRIVHV